MTMTKVELGGKEINVFDNSFEFTFGKLNIEDLLRTFEEQGFVLIRSAVEASKLQIVNDAFEAEIVPSRDHFQRQTVGYAPHEFHANGYMKKAIMNIQDFKQARYQLFRSSFLDITTSKAINDLASQLIKANGSIVYTMFFDGNQQTCAHRDSHTIDAEKEGGMIGVWIAAQDIHPSAGRFFLVEGSHRLAVPELDALHPADSETPVKWTRWVGDSGLRVVAPQMRVGDIILFHSLTVHGSLPTTDPRFSRRSLTCHYIPSEQGYTWFRASGSSMINQSDAVLSEYNGVNIIHHGSTPHSPAAIWRNKISKAARFSLKAPRQMANRIIKIMAFR